MQRSSSVFHFTLCAVIGLFASPSSQASEQPQLGAMMTYMHASSVRQAGAEMPGLQLSAMMPLARFKGWSMEAMAGWQALQRDDQSGDDQQYLLGFDVLRRFELGDRFTPYSLAGLALAYEDVRADSSIQPTLSLGGGLLWQTVMPALQLRLDLRAQLQEQNYYQAGADVSGRTVMVDGRMGLGALWQFGRAEGACAPGDCVADEDGDGVADGEDLCVESLPGAIVDRTGCEPVSLRDTDGDGVLDNQDACPATPPGEVVDDAGCPAQPSVVLQGVEFAFGSDELSDEAKDVLRPIAQLLNGGLSVIRIEIAGHTDNVGDDDFNQALSARRAYAVKKFLASRGVSADRMVATGYGALRPVADNATAEGRARNRRVVFRVMD